MSSKKLFCSICEKHHDVKEFGTKQQRKSAKKRVCKNPKSPLKKYTYTSYSEFCDDLEFGSRRYGYYEPQDSDDEYGIWTV